MQSVRPGGAQAQDREAPCGASVDRWVGEADAANDARLFARTCRGAVVVIGVLPEGAAGYDVQLERSPRPAFRRVGAYALQPLMETPDFSAIPAPQRLAFEQLAAWVEANEAQLELPTGSVPTWALWLERFDPHLGNSPVLVLVALLLLLVARKVARPSPDAPTSESPTRTLLGLFTLALGLRVVFGAWAPHHVHLGVLWVVAATSDANELVHFGPGYPEVFGWITRLSPVSRDYALYLANALVGAASAPLCVGLARRMGLDTRRALALGLLIACDPIAVRFGATETYHPIVLLLSLGVSALSLDAARLVATGERQALVATLLAAALLGAQCARVHPVAWLLVAVAPLAGLAAPVPLRARALALLALTAVSGAVIVLLDGAVMLRVLQSVASGQLMRSEWQLAPLPLVIVGALALTWAAVPSARGLALVATAHALLFLATHENFAQAPLRHATHERLHLTFPLLATLACIPPRLAARPLAPLALAAALALLLLIDLPIIANASGTAQWERAELRSFLRDLPAGCRTAHVAFAGRYGMFLPTYAGPERPAGTFVRLDGRRDMDLASALGEPGCLYYLRTSLCATGPGADACADAERQLTLEPASAHWSFDAVPRDEYARAEGARVHVSASRVRGIHPRATTSSEAAQ